jgi:hypothetical protein
MSLHKTISLIAIRWMGSFGCREIHIFRIQCITSGAFFNNARNSKCHTSFPRRFSLKGDFSPIYIRVFPVVFLESKHALRGDISFSRRKRGFLSRVFANGQVHLFVIIISRRAFNGQPLKATMPREKGGQLHWRKILRLSPFAPRKQRVMRGRISPRESPRICPVCIEVSLFPQATLLSRSERRQWISLTIDEHQNSRRGGTKPAKIFSDFDIFRGRRT